MTLSALGIFSAAGAGGAPDLPSDYVLINTQILGTAQSSITFNVSGLGSTYRHLQIRAVARDTATNESRSVALRFNGDTGTNYNSHLLIGINLGSNQLYSEGAANTTSLRAGTIPGNQQNANVYGSLIVDLLDPFSTTKNKTGRTFGGFFNTANPYLFEIGTYSGAWRNTSAITSIEMLGGTSFMAGSRFSIYGIRG